MNRNFVLSLMVLAQLLLLGCQTELNQTVEPNTVPTPEVVVETAPSCARPSEEMKADCDAMAQQVLSATVRLHVRRWQKDDSGQKGEFVDGGVGHGTVKDGRYLVTHNHYGIPLADVDNAELIQVTVKNWRGEMVLQDMPLTAVTVVAVDAETLILDFGQYGETGLFEMMGVPSAEFQSHDSLSLQVGMEVAQVDWDGETAHVDWVLVESVDSENGVPQLKLANGLTEGASGGGVFWNGVHVANNWTSNSSYNQQTGDLLNQFSVAAANSSQSLSVASAQTVNAS
ncbi:MAG: hypothetical protein DWQ04_25940 [Chloroflexi bacterium]|nr:MAG: hypothetical protein DWQ04_25940 [Chloroflexota bacterium]